MTAAAYRSLGSSCRVRDTDEWLRSGCWRRPRAGASAAALAASDRVSCPQSILGTFTRTSTRPSRSTASTWTCLEASKTAGPRTCPSCWRTTRSSRGCSPTSGERRTGLVRPSTPSRGPVLTPLSRRTAFRIALDTSADAPLVYKVPQAFISPLA